MSSDCLRAADEDVAVGRERGGGPARGLVAVEERAVVVAVSFSTPSMKMTRFGSTVMIAPIFCRIAMRSMISGSIAAFFSSVTPSASTAVSSTCSVAPTLGYGSSMSRPSRPLGAVRRMPS